ncbi:MAG: hypothetical protein ACLQDL_16590 [Spirochaetia bacterium]
MPNEAVFLAALIAPGSIESEVGKLQAALFSAHGLASAQALPPLIPIAFLDDAARVTRALLAELNGSIRQGWRIRLTGPLWVEGHLYAGVDSGGAWGSLRARALELCGAEKARLFPAAEGFYLGCADAAPEEKSLIRPTVPEASFSSSTIALLSVHADFEGSTWWRDVHWEVVEERPLRGRKAQ